MDYQRAYVWWISAVAAMGGLLFGYDWVVIGGARPFYEPYFRLDSEALIAWANGCALLGCLLGALVPGTLAERFGRKPLLLFTAFLFAVSSLLTGWAPTFASFVIWRIAGGVAIGIASNVAPMYIAEVSPAPWRGRLVAMNQLAIVIGILVAQLVNWWIAASVPIGATAEIIRLSWNGQFGWRWMFSAIAVPSAIFFASAWFVPESPRWLVKKGQLDEARTMLRRVGGESYASEALQEIEQSLSTEAVHPADWQDLFSGGIRKLLMIGIGLAVLQQWSGINVIFNYAAEIYRDAGYGISDILFNIVITGAINLVFTIVALGFVDRIGRRLLMLAGCAGIGLSHLLLGIVYLSGLKGLPVVILTLCAIGCYAMSLAPVTWVLISELFPNRVRGLAMSASVSALWIACFLLTYTFPLLNRAAGAAGTFFIYAAVCAGGFLFVQFCVPETSGKSLEQIERELSGPAAFRAAVGRSRAPRAPVLAGRSADRGGIAGNEPSP